MRRVFKIALATAALSFAVSASPAMAGPTLVADGVTYQLILDSITNSGLTGNYTLQISGINTASDTEGSRTGINGFAFNDAPTAVSGTSSGFTFQLGGLNQAGCDGSGTGFFCFKNSGATFDFSSHAASLDFSVTSNTAGSWDNWAPDFKIDWIGTANRKGNYDLVSLPISVNTRLPEPGTWALMLLGFGGVGMAMRRNRKSKPGLMQIA
jgi:hypothetical protein